ncbi:hypothetical protein [Sphingomonas baiyangensis]|uniref:Uncharacterized protein n=1 Tax=Sphingomonas baiyangensis TaxID=2572576 RepID=A0A4U1L2Z7_9SPHN|nr:hypothetical protein [Sphingomonas baiyangensis]TKD50563.1 hypothetical protein FBR43_07140 [Sphingomonas baiyangensis]
MTKSFTADTFRAELTKAMPGYQWTVHRAPKDAVQLRATGIKTSGFNRISTLCVDRTTARGFPWYSARCAGFGTRAPFLGEYSDGTLLRTLSGLQRYFEQKANTYAAHARQIKSARPGAEDEKL